MDLTTGGLTGVDGTQVAVMEAMVIGIDAVGVIPVIGVVQDHGAVAVVEDMVEHQELGADHSVAEVEVAVDTVVDTVDAKNLHQK